VSVPPATIGPTRGPLLSRIGAALALRPDFYAAAAADRTATGPAGAIVCVVAMLRESVVVYEISQIFASWGLILPILAFVALLGWLLIGAVAWIVTRPAATAATSYRALLRCLGFAQTPTMLFATLAAAADPTLYLILYAALTAWAFAAIVVALRAATATTTARATVLAVPVFLAQFAVLVASRVLVLG
jgi:hypothetical protein